MKFWLKKLGSDKFIGPMTYEDIQEQIQKGRAYLEDEVLEATGQSLGELKRSTGWVTISTIRPQENTSLSQAQKIDSGLPNIDRTPQQISSAQEQSPSNFLETVRNQTCYAALREMIGLFTSLSIIGIITLAGFYFIIGLQNQSTLHVIIGAVMGLLGICLVIASKQAALLLVDIADTLIEQNRKKRRD
jgi:hypothetical protein